MNQNDKNIATFESKHGGLFYRLIRWLTKFAWEHQVRSPVNWLYEKRLINSEVLHKADVYTVILLKGK